MATSSLYKAFCIESEKEAGNFVKMLVDSVESPPPVREEVPVEDVPREEWERLVAGTLGAKE